MNNEASNLLLNDVKEYIRWRKLQRDNGREFIKKVTKFSKTSAAIYLPKRLIGRTFKVFLMPIDVDDRYEIAEASDKKVEKLLKDTEKDLEKIQTEDAPRKNLIHPIL